MICDCLPIVGVLLSEILKSIIYFFCRLAVQSSGATRLHRPTVSGFIIFRVINLDCRIQGAA
jgi:hypothetical protein